MIFTVLYYDKDISEDKLQEYSVEANDHYEAERLFNDFAKGSEAISLCNIVSERDLGEVYDAHSCRAHADADGVCQWCGAVIHGSVADHELHGY